MKSHIFMRLRGNADLYVVGALVLVLLGAVWAGHTWYMNALDEAREAGRNEVRNTVLADRNAQLVAVQKKVAELTAALLEAEERAQKAIADAEEKGRKGVADAEARKEKFVGDVVAGRIKLHDPGRIERPSCPGGSGTAEAQVAGDPSVGDGTGGAELSVQLGSFLGSEAARADKVVAKVWTLQGIVRACEKLLEER